MIQVRHHHPCFTWLQINIKCKVIPMELTMLLSLMDFQFDRIWVLSRDLRSLLLNSDQIRLQIRKTLLKRKLAGLPQDKEVLTFNLKEMVVKLVDHNLR